MSVFHLLPKAAAAGCYEEKSMLTKKKMFFTIVGLFLVIFYPSRKSETRGTSGRALEFPSHFRLFIWTHLKPQRGFHYRTRIGKCPAAEAEQQQLVALFNRLSGTDASSNLQSKGMEARNSSFAQFAEAFQGLFNGEPTRWQMASMMRILAL